MQNFSYHQHTYRCKHADMIEDEEYVKECIKMGIKTLAFTDHCPEKVKIDFRDNSRMDYDKRQEYLDSINFLKRKYADQIDIKVGYEVEYLPGEEENLKELKDETDILILGQHFIYGNDNSLKLARRDYPWDREEKLKFAQYIEKAMEIGIPDIIAHPDIFMCSCMEFGDDEKEVTHLICSAAEKYNVPLEINLNRIFANTYFDYKNKVMLPYKPVEEHISSLEKVIYPNKEFWKIASNYDIKVLYGIDSHRKGQNLLFRELIELANILIGEKTINNLNFTQD